MLEVVVAAAVSVVAAGALVVLHRRSGGDHRGVSSMGAAAQQYPSVPAPHPSVRVLVGADEIDEALRRAARFEETLAETVGNWTRHHEMLAASPETPGRTPAVPRTGPGSRGGGDPHPRAA